MPTPVGGCDRMSSSSGAPTDGSIPSPSWTNDPPPPPEPPADGAVVGEGGGVEAGRPHGGEGGGRVAVAVGQEAVVVEVGVGQPRPLWEEAGGPPPPPRGGAAPGERRRR